MISLIGMYVLLTYQLKLQSDIYIFTLICLTSTMCRHIVKNAVLHLAFCHLLPIHLFLHVDMSLRLIFPLMWTQSQTEYSSSRLWQSSW